VIVKTASATASLKLSCLRRCVHEDDVSVVFLCCCIMLLTDCRNFCCRVYCTDYLAVLGRCTVRQELNGVQSFSLSKNSVSSRFSAATSYTNVLMEADRSSSSISD
jgi:hypothetical protein